MASERMCFCSYTPILSPTSSICLWSQISSIMLKEAVISPLLSLTRS